MKNILVIILALFWVSCQPVKDKKEEDQTSTQIWTVDDDYIKTLGLNLVARRNFSKTMTTESQADIINKSEGRKETVPFGCVPNAKVGLMDRTVHYLQTIAKPAKTA